MCEFYFHNAKFFTSDLCNQNFTKITYWLHKLKVFEHKTALMNYCRLNLINLI